MTANGASNGTDNKWIGKRTIRPDGVDKVTGRATFGADFSQPGMLHGKVSAQPPSACAHQSRSISTRRWRCRGSKR